MSQFGLYTNKYAGTCSHCSTHVPKGSGFVERVYGKFLCYCSKCADNNDNSSYEDRECGNMAYEDRCAEICGF